MSRIPAPRRQERVGLVLGGGSLRQRMSLLERSLARAEVICVAGRVATTLGHQRDGITTLGQTREERLAHVRIAGLLRGAELRGATVIWPCDLIAFRDHPDGRAYASATPEELVPGWTMGDAGPGTLAAFREALAPLDTVIWTGALGLAGEYPFASASIALARMLSRTRPGGGPRLVLSGRDTVAVVRAAGVEVMASSLARQQATAGRPSGTESRTPREAPNGEA